MDMPQNDFKLETTFSDSSATFFRPVALIVAIAFIVGIVLTMTTGLAAWLLPMSDRHLLALVPRAADGTEALSLLELEQETAPDTLVVSAAVLNRTDFSLSGLLAVIDVQDRFGLTMTTATVPLDPEPLPAGQMARFHTTIPVDQQLSGYSLKFQLADGPFVPHRDDRATLTVPAPNEEHGDETR